MARKGKTEKDRLPGTLLEAIRYFNDPDVCVSFVARLRWPDGPECPSCEGKEHSYLTTRRLWKCKACKRQFSVKVGTIFEDSPIGLDKWLAAIWMIANAKNGISSHEVARHLGVTQKTGWFLLHRIRLAMQSGTFRRLSGEVEVDETFIGGSARYMHEAEKKRKATPAGGPLGKTIVFGAVERGGQVRATVIPDTTGPTLQGEVRNTVRGGTRLYSDSYVGYGGLGLDYEHKTVDHAIEYVSGQVHTQTIENFWSLLKRGLKGTYISVEPFHLFRCLDEQVFRFNTRKANDFTRFAWVLAMVAGRRLTYARLTGKV